MPVLLTQNIVVSHETEARDDFKRIQSRRKSRLTVYMTTAKEQQEDEVSLFNETYVQSMLEEQQERKKKIRRFEKLKLVWKGAYQPGKPFQEIYNDFIASRSCRSKFRLTHTAGNAAATSNFGRTRSIFSQKQSSSITQDVLTSQKSSAKTSSASLLKPTTKALNVNKETPENKVEHRLTNHVVAEHDAVLNTGSLENSSVTLCGRQSLTLGGRRFSRNTFNTRRATDNQEQNMFSYRSDRKRPIVTQTVVSEQKRKDSCDSLLKAMKSMQHWREKLVPELKGKVDVDTLLRAYLSEQFLELNLEGPEALEVRRLYTATILRQPVIYNLIMKHPDMIPSRIFTDLVTYKKGFEVNPIYAPTVVKAEESAWRGEYIRTNTVASGNVLIELERDMPLYANFYKPLIEKRSECQKIDSLWLTERRPQAIRENIHHLTINLRVGRHNPGSTVRFDIVQLFIAAGRNDRLLRQLGLTVEGWLDQLVKGLCSPFKSVREETCQVLCYMTSNYPVMKELYLSKYFDVVQDLCLSILRAIEQFEDTFSEYYILLAHLIHYCPSRSIIDCIIERWMNFRCVSLILRWPRLIYYALRYWPDDALCLGSRLFFIRLTRALESALQRPVTAKVTRNALYYLQVRFSFVCNIFSIYCNKESAHSTFMQAFKE